jgi:hypothetical protein
MSHPAPISVRLDPEVRAVLEDYAAMLDALPHRTVVKCHRMTERRMRKIMHGVKQPHDVEVVDL